MKKIITVSTNEKTVKVVENSCMNFKSFFHAEFLGTTEAAINFINYELPEIKVLDFTSEGIDCDEIIDSIHKDSWLHYGGIIAVCKDRAQVRQLEERKDGNILASLTQEDFSQNFERLLRILYKNQHFLYTRGMQDTLGGREKGTFICGNDPMDLRFYTNFLVSYLYNTNRISNEDRAILQMTLMELLMNAVEHGNLNISYEEKNEWLKNGGDIFSLIKKRSSEPKYANRKIHISYLIKEAASAFRIEDDGDGFDWRNAVDNTDNLEENGRGISITKQFVQKLAYNEKGNQVTFSIKNSKNVVNAIPSIMDGFDAIEYKNKEVICRQDEESNDLFFIVQGRFAVYVNGTLSSILTPADIFIGEMAFLLNDRRTATVVAVGNCKLIRLSKTAFLALIRKNPHYGIFLSKMLAQRLALQAQYSYIFQQKMQEMQTMIKPAT